MHSDVFSQRAFKRLTSHEANSCLFTGWPTGRIVLKKMNFTACRATAVFPVL